MKVSSFSEIEDEFIRRVHKMVWCAAATIDAKERPRSRLLHTIWEGSTGWAATRRHSLKAKHLDHNPHVSLAYIADIARPVYVDCTASWRDDPATKQRIWRMFSGAPPPLGYDPGLIFAGVDSSDFGVLRFTPWRIELFDIANKDDPRRVWLA